MHGDERDLDRSRLERGDYSRACPALGGLHGTRGLRLYLTWGMPLADQPDRNPATVGWGEDLLAIGIGWICLNRYRIVARLLPTRFEASGTVERDCPYTESLCTSSCTGRGVQVLDTSDWIGIRTDTKQ